MTTTTAEQQSAPATTTTRQTSSTTTTLSIEQTPVPTATAEGQPAPMTTTMVQTAITTTTPSIEQTPVTAAPTQQATATPTTIVQTATTTTTTPSREQTPVTTNTIRQSTPTTATTVQTTTTTTTTPSREQTPVTPTTAAQIPTITTSRPAPVQPPQTATTVVQRPATTTTASTVKSSTITNTAAQIPTTTAPSPSTVQAPLTTARVVQTSLATSTPPPILQSPAITNAGIQTLPTITPRPASTTPAGAAQAPSTTTTVEQIPQTTTSSVQILPTATAVTTIRPILTTVVEALSTSPNQITTTTTSALSNDNNPTTVSSPPAATTSTVQNTDSATSSLDNNRNTQNIPNSNPNRPIRKRREVGGNMVQNSGINNNTTDLFQGIDVMCANKTLIRKTECIVTLQLNQTVRPCCILRTLCTGNQSSSGISVVGKRVDRMRQMGIMCNNTSPEEEQGCIYSGETNGFCKDAVFNQTNSTDCDAANCTCSTYCNRNDSYYTFTIGVQDPTITFSQVSALIFSIKQLAFCTLDSNGTCSSISEALKDASVNCGGTSVNLQKCSVILRFGNSVDICSVARTVRNILESLEQINFDGVVTHAAICGNLGNNELLKSQLTWVRDGRERGSFCGNIQASNHRFCQNGTNVVVLLKEKCDVSNETTIQLNSTTMPPNVTSTFNTTAPQFNTTQNVTTTTANVTMMFNTTTLQPNTTQDVNTTTANVTMMFNTTTLQPNTTQDANTTTANVTTVFNTTTLQPNTTQDVNTTTANVTMFNTTTLQPNTTQDANTTTANVTTMNTTTRQPNTTQNANVTMTNATTLNITPQPDTTQNVNATTVNASITQQHTTQTANTTATTTENTPSMNITTPEVVPTTQTERPTTTASAEASADALFNLTRDVSSLNSSDVNNLVSQLEDLLSGPTVSRELGNTSVHIVSNLLGASPEILADSSERIIRIVDTVGLRLELDTEAQSLIASDLSVAARPVDGTNFQGTSFSVLNPSDVQVRGDSRLRRSTRVDSSIPQGSITLPPSLTQNLTSEEQLQASRVHFNFYQRSTVFQDPTIGTERRLNSGILGAAVANLSIRGLQDNVTINLRHLEPTPANFVATCVFWDFEFNDGSGGWNADGCNVLNSTDNETICGCNHLTSFAILLNLGREPVISRIQATILTFITYIGCGVSAIFLSVTLLTYLAFGKLRKDIPSKILIQLCFALLLLNLVFLVDAWLALYPDAVGLCISTAWFLHYFLLVSFTWMGVEAFHMYQAIVKVFNSHISYYMLRCSVVGWGLPMIVVIIVIAIDKDNYGLVTYARFTDGTADDFCWLRNDIAFYVAVVAYFCVIFVFNFAMFIVVLVQLCRIRKQNPHNNRHRSMMQDVRSVSGLTILLGLTWGFAFFAWGPVNLPFMYLFAIFNSLQGFFIFVFYCAVKENVRRQWRTYLCCGKLRLAENSEWSRTATQKTVKRSSVTNVTSVNSTNGQNSSSSSSFLVRDSPQPSNDLGNPLDDSVITADEEAHSDVVQNEANSTRHRHRSVS